ncbi:MAG: PcfB family protein [Lachnospiraceae bacterium]|nr:PcfB family protein [Lachnospiraceae bacterium]
MSSEITDAVQIIHILFEGADLCLRVTGKCLKPLAQLTKLIMGILAREKMEGKTSMKNLLKRGGDMHVFKFPQEQMKKVEAMAKKYGILYSLLPDFNKDGMRELVFHAESLPRMNALIEKLKAGQVMGLEEYFQNTSDRDIDKFFEETQKGRTTEKTAGKETETMQKNTASKEQKQPWMETGYLKMKDIEAIPLEQRLNILDHYQSGEYDPITITSKLVTKQTEDHVMVRLPRQSGKYIRIPIEDFYFPEGSRTALAFLKKKEEMKVYAELGDEMFTMKGSEIFHNYFDTVNANIRTAVEHRSEERELGQDSRENSNAERSSQPENRKSSREKDTGEKAVKNTAEKAKNIGKEVKQPVRGR